MKLELNIEKMRLRAAAVLLSAGLSLVALTVFGQSALPGAQQSRSGSTPPGAAKATPQVTVPPSGALQRPPQFSLPAVEEEIAVLVVAGEETTLSSQMGGRLLKVNVGLGESVAKDTVLMEFDCSEQQANLQAAQAEYRGLRETHLTKLKLQALGAAGELEVTVAASAADKAKSQVDVRESQLAYCKVTAPFAGKVARMRVKASESVNLGQPLVELVNSATLKAQMFVPSSYISVLKPGAAFQIRMEGGKVYRARVAKINSRVEGVSQQLEVEGRFEGSISDLLPGMVGTALFPGRR